MEAGVVVEGLDELRRHLRSIQPQLARAIGDGQREVVRNVVHPVAVANLAAQRVPRSPSIRVFATQKEAGLRYTAPWAAGAEFGSLAFKQFKPWVGNSGPVWAGYVMGAAIRSTLAVVELLLTDAIEKAIMKRAGL